MYGYLWAGTESGAVLYSDPESIFGNTDFYGVQPSVDLGDGLYHPLLENLTITSIAVDGGNRKWFGTTNGISKFDGTNWTVYNKTTAPGGLLSNYIRAIRKGAGSALYFCTEGGLAKLDAGQWVNYKRTAGGLPSDTVTTLLFVAPNTVYAGTPGAGMVSFNQMREVSTNAI